jgi:hypothetical protein
MPVVRHPNNKRNDPQFCPTIRNSKRQAGKKNLGAETSRRFLEEVLR